YVPNSFALYPFADPHPLNPAVSTFYKNVGGRALSAPNLPPRFNSFNCNIYRPCPVNVANNRLMLQLSSLDATLTKKTGWGSRLWGWGFRLRLPDSPCATCRTERQDEEFAGNDCTNGNARVFVSLESTHAPPTDSHCSDSVAPSSAARRGCRMVCRSCVSPPHPPRVDSGSHSRSRRLLRGHWFNARRFRRACARWRSSPRLES